VGHPAHGPGFVAPRLLPQDVRRDPSTTATAVEGRRPLPGNPVSEPELAYLTPEASGPRRDRPHARRGRLDSAGLLTRQPLRRPRGRGARGRPRAPARTRGRPRQHAAGNKRRGLGARRTAQVNPDSAYEPGREESRPFRRNQPGSRRAGREEGVDQRGGVGTWAWGPTPGASARGGAVLRRQRLRVC
jgi:hypothetical protein